MKKKNVGIVLLVLGAAAALGAVANGTFASFTTHFDLSNLFMVLIMIGLVISGIVLILKGRKK